MKKSNCECDANTQSMRCLVCGDEVPIPIGACEWTAGVMKLFDKMHASAKHEPGQTRFTIMVSK